MRPLRLLISLTFCVIAITLLLYFNLASQSHDIPASPPSTQKKGRVRALFSFHTPLFPPSAIISLTDDNSTFFVARPAAFGPLLPSKGLNGQLWIGSGFGDDNLGRGGLIAGLEGELGCSDVPGWDDGSHQISGNIDLDGGAKRSPVKGFVANGGSGSSRHNRPSKEDILGEGTDDSDIVDSGLHVEGGDDGTDDHLHRRYSNVPQSLDDGAGWTATKPTEHADIQSLQESAEIAGKIVLLSRGGCGFLDKVKWTQRRGGVALIVGDNVRGGPLVTMYARGDTSNITIPALFTSHGTAHLLSSLIPSGGIVGGLLPEKTTKLGISVGKNPSKDSKSKGAAPMKKALDDRPIFTSSVVLPNPTSVTRGTTKKPAVNAVGVPSDTARVGWLRSMLPVFNLGSGKRSLPITDSRRPPNSGHIDWVPVEEWEDESLRSTSESKSGEHKPKQAEATSSKVSGDGFLIGVHDWRDPDLVATIEPESIQSSGHRNFASPSAQSIEYDGDEVQALKGGSITPGSGEYEKPTDNPISLNSLAYYVPKTAAAEGEAQAGKGHGWLSRLGWTDGDDDDQVSPAISDNDSHVSVSMTQRTPDANGDQQDDPSHEGLWVTLTPTTMSSSPFFDTLLVLVISPLITLTVVYALLLLRARIRRRRWRAPKSVVERLPVRTYHSISNETTTTATPRAASPAPAPPTLTTPLLQSTSRASSSRPRPRSRTTSEVPEQTSSALRRDRQGSASSEAEKRVAGLAEWRRKYGGRQKECVVCLEEYVDGVSRVMSLPCGHEFHAECITPWLTTRRRTCPICKGDVVRMSGSTARPPSLHSDSSDDEDIVQTRAAENRNDSPSAAMPISTDAADDDYADLESGHEREASERPNDFMTAMYRAFERLGLSRFSDTERRGRQSLPDRDR